MDKLRYKKISRKRYFNKKSNKYPLQNRPNFSKAYFNSRYKTKLCSHYLSKGYCEYKEKCEFAHGKYELRRPMDNMHDTFKSKPCYDYHYQGFCNEGIRC